MEGHNFYDADRGFYVLLNNKNYKDARRGNSREESIKKKIVKKAAREHKQKQENEEAKIAIGISTARIVIPSEMQEKSSKN